VATINGTAGMASYPGSGCVETATMRGNAVSLAAHWQPVLRQIDYWSAGDRIKLFPLESTSLTVKVTDGHD
jgi:hypothetical protein